MEETDRGHVVLRYVDALLKNILKTVQSSLSDYCRDLSKIVAISEMNSEKFDSNKILEGNQILYRENKVMKKAFECSIKCSAVGGKRDLINESQSTDGNIAVSDLSIGNFPAKDSKNILQNVSILKTLKESGKMSNLFNRSRHTSDTVGSIESKIIKSIQRKSEDIRTSDSKISDENFVSTQDTEKDAPTSSKRNLQIFPTVGFYSESNSNIPSSNLKISENDSKASLDEKFAGEFLGEFQRIINQQNIFNRDFMNCDSDTLSNSPNDSQCSTELPASLMSTNDGHHHRQFASKLSEATNNALHHTFLDANPVQPENFNTSEISHSNLKLSESDQEVKLDKYHYATEKTLRNIIKSFSEFQDFHQVTSGKSSELDQTLDGRFTVSDEGMENNVSDNINTTDDDYDYLYAPISSEDRNQAVQNYISSIDSIPSMDSTLLNDYSANPNTDLKSSDSDRESYHSDLMFSCSDNESNPNKRSSHDLQELIADEAISRMGLPSVSDQVNFIGHHEAKDEVSTNFDFDEELLLAETLISSEDPETALQDYFSNMPSEYWQSDLTSSNDKQDLNPETLSHDVLSVQDKVQNLINHITELKARVQVDISAGVISGRENSSDIDSVNIASVHEAKEEVSANSINTNDEIHIIQALVSSEDPETSLADYFSSRMSAPFNALNVSSKPSEYCHSDLTSSDSNENLNSNSQSHEILRFLGKVKNLMNDAADIQGLLKLRQDLIAEAEAISNIERASENDEVNIVSSHETKENEMNTVCINTDDASDRLEALIGSEASNDYSSSRNSKPSRDSMFSGNESEYNKSDLLSSDTFKERSCVSKVGKELKNIANAFQYFIQKQDNGKISSKMDFAPDIDRLSSPGFHEKRKNEETEPCDGQYPSKRSEAMNQLKKSFFPIPPFARTNSNFSDRDSETFESGLKFPKKEREMSSFKQSMKSDDGEALERRLSRKVGLKRKIDDSFDKKPDSDNSKRSFNGSAETEENNIETIDEIFKKVIKCHPIKKFEIPPYASANTGDKLWKLDDHFPKYASGAVQLNGTNEHRNILEYVFNVDSHSIMTFDVTDCFSQNSNIICNSLIKEYIDISTKVNLFLLKEIRNISSQEHESRIHSLHLLDDELGYMSAKLITTLNDWNKQFDETKENFAQSRIGSRGVYHMALILICMHLCFILHTFTLEKQLELEDYEKVLIFHHQKGN